MGLVTVDTFRRRVRSAENDTCIVSRTQTRLGGRSLAVAGPRLWNSLLTTFRNTGIEWVNSENTLMVAEAAAH